MVNPLNPNDKIELTNYNEAEQKLIKDIQIFFTNCKQQNFFKNKLKEKILPILESNCLLSITNIELFTFDKKRNNLYYIGQEKHEEMSPFENFIHQEFEKRKESYLYMQNFLKSSEFITRTRLCFSNIFNFYFSNDRKMFTFNYNYYNNLFEESNLNGKLRFRKLF